MRGLYFICWVLVCTSCKKELISDVKALKCGEGAGPTAEHTKTASYSERLIFKAGTEGYHTYRIPAIIKTKSGALIAFCEGRKNSSADYGDIDLVAKRSADNGRTWGPLQVIWDDGGATCGNPTPVVDQQTGKIWLFMSWNSAEKNETGSNGYQLIDTFGDRRVFTLFSTDDGLSWQGLTDRTLDLTPNTFIWDAVGPGNGIQLTEGPFKGRLVIPAKGRSIYSDDGGTTWSYQLIPEGTSEGCVVEHCDSTLMRNDRSAGPFIERKRRIISISKDYGETWSPWQVQEDLPDPICQASIIRFDESYPSRLIFINPNSTLLRTNTTVRISYDNGASWPIRRELQSWTGGYSSLCKTQDGMIGSLQELGGLASNLSPNGSIWFRKFNISWILNGKPEPVQ